MKTVQFTKIALATIAASLATAAFASPAPQVGAATLNPAAQMQKNIHDLHVYGGPKANPAIVNGGIQKAGVSGVGASAAMDDTQRCGNVPRKIPGLGGGGVGPAGSASYDGEWCGTRVPGKFPGGPGPHVGNVNVLTR
jgi:hypothetical protein